MRKSKKPIVIASRRSRLARAQAEMIGKRLARLHRGIEIQYRWIESQGDVQLERSLANTGGKGLFAGAIEQALLTSQADIAVHSLKDLPAVDTPGLTIAAVPARADVRDCLITHHAGVRTVEDLPHGAVVGTASPRRAAQLRRLRPDFHIELIRGNVDTRLRKTLEDKQYDATLLAVAGLERLGDLRYAVNILPTQVMLPAACQGALALQVRRDDHISLSRCLPLNNADASLAVHTERQIVAALKGDCHSPIAVLAQPREVEGKVGFHIHVKALSPDGSECIEREFADTSKNFSRGIKALIKDLKCANAHKIIRKKLPDNSEVKI